MSQQQPLQSVNQHQQQQQQGSLVTIRAWSQYRQEVTSQSLMNLAQLLDCPVLALPRPMGWGKEREHRRFALNPSKVLSLQLYFSTQLNVYRAFAAGLQQTGIAPPAYEDEALFTRLPANEAGVTDFVREVTGVMHKILKFLGRGRDRYAPLVNVAQAWEPSAAAEVAALAVTAATAAPGAAAVAGAAVGTQSEAASAVPTTVEPAMRAPGAAAATLVPLAAAVPGAAAAPAAATLVPTTAAVLGAAAVPGASAAVPGASAAVAGIAAAALGAAAVLGIPGAVPGASAAVPGASAAGPGAAAVPGIPAAVLGASAAVPGASAAVPDASAAVPGASAAVPGASAAVPDASAAVPGAAAVPGIPAAVPAASAAVAGIAAAVLGAAAAAAPTLLLASAGEAVPSSSAMAPVASGSVRRVSSSSRQGSGSSSQRVADLVLLQGMHNIDESLALFISAVPGLQSLADFLAEHPELVPETESGGQAQLLGGGQPLGPPPPPQQQQQQQPLLSGRQPLRPPPQQQQQQQQPLLSGGQPLGPPPPQQQQPLLSGEQPLMPPPQQQQQQQPLLSGEQPLVPLPPPPQPLLSGEQPLVPPPPQQQQQPLPSGRQPLEPPPPPPQQQQQPPLPSQRETGEQPQIVRIQIIPMEGRPIVVIEIKKGEKCVTAAGHPLPLVKMFVDGEAHAQSLFGQAFTYMVQYKVCIAVLTCHDVLWLMERPNCESSTIYVSDPILATNRGPEHPTVLLALAWAQHKALLQLAAPPPDTVQDSSQGSEYTPSSEEDARSASHEAVERSPSGRPLRKKQKLLNKDYHYGSLPSEYPDAAAPSDQELVVVPHHDQFQPLQQQQQQHIDLQQRFMQLQQVLLRVQQQPGKLASSLPVVPTSVVGLDAGAEVLGRGLSATVFRGRFASQDAAIKVVAWQAEAVLREAALYNHVSPLQDIVVPKLMGMGKLEVACKDLSFLALSLVPGTPLSGAEITPDIRDAAMSAVRRFHSFAVVHGDLTLDNMLLLGQSCSSSSSGNIEPRQQHTVMLVDLGSARIGTAGECDMELQQLQSKLAARARELSGGDASSLGKAAVTGALCASEAQ